MQCTLILYKEYVRLRVASLYFKNKIQDKTIRGTEECLLRIIR